MMGLPVPTTTQSPARVHRRLRGLLERWLARRAPEAVDRTAWSPSPRTDSPLRALAWLVVSPWALVTELLLGALLLGGRAPLVGLLLLATALAAVAMLSHQWRRYNYTFVPYGYSYFLRKVSRPSLERHALPGSTRLAVILPVRDRQAEVDELLRHLPPFLEAEGIADYEVWVVEQAPGKAFSRAKLSNVGFLEASKGGTRNTFAFHDVDVIPVDRQRVTFSRVDHIRHLYGRPYALGCVFVASERCFRAINGYSNLYWGPGWQDKDLFRRAVAKGVRVERGFDRYTGGFREMESYWANQVRRYRLFTDRRDELLRNRRLFEEQSDLERVLRQIAQDGLSSCDYRVVSERRMRDGRVRHLVIEA